MPKRPFQYRFDFEIGYLKKSPCKSCVRRKIFPRCLDRCRVLEEIHTLLAEVISCSRRQ